MFQSKDQAAPLPAPICRDAPAAQTTRYRLDPRPYRSARGHPRPIRYRHLAGGCRRCSCLRNRLTFTGADYLGCGCTRCLEEGCRVDVGAVGRVGGRSGDGPSGGGHRSTPGGGPRAGRRSRGGSGSVRCGARRRSVWLGACAGDAQCALGIEQQDSGDRSPSRRSDRDTTATGSTPAAQSFAWRGLASKLDMALPSLDDLSPAAERTGARRACIGVHVGEARAGKDVPGHAQERDRRRTGAPDGARAQEDACRGWTCIVVRGGRLIG